MARADGVKTEIGNSSCGVRTFRLLALILTGLTAGCAKQAMPKSKTAEPATAVAVVPYYAGLTRPTPLPARAIEYPPEAIEAGVSGTVVVKCMVTIEGTPRNCRVVQSVPLMDGAVLAALERHRGVPAMLDGRPVGVEYTYRVNFTFPSASASSVPRLLDANTVVASLGPQFDLCHAEGLREDPAMSGRVVVEATVESGGGVEQVAILRRDGSLSDAVVACVSSVIRTARFALTPGAGRARIQVPVYLARAQPRP